MKTENLTFERETNNIRKSKITSASAIANNDKKKLFRYYTRAF